MWEGRAAKTRGTKAEARAKKKTPQSQSPPFKGAMSRNCACSATTSQLEKIGPTFSSFAGRSTYRIHRLESWPSSNIFRFRRFCNIKQSFCFRLSGLLFSGSDDYGLISIRSMSINIHNFTYSIERRTTARGLLHSAALGYQTMLAHIINKMYIFVSGIVVCFLVT